ncbi:hypothetical protein DPMN_168404 [Dreissena polymorpha]|uniref:Uncharacterized protein n=1 Tax=Dreissena polymorpha TaxID=45954 RepID=A0A9D4F1W4_DREPO|nr:hypothetical protein DPMN_168404 [Dreissena polymorpha]
MNNNNITGRVDGRTHTGVPQSTDSVMKGKGDVKLPEGFMAFPRNQLHAVMQGRPILKSRSYKCHATLSIKQTATRVIHV